MVYSALIVPQGGIVESQMCESVLFMSHMI